MAADNKFNEAVDGRIKKSKYAWDTIKKKLIFNEKLNNKIKIRLFNSLILSILTYGLTTHNLNQNLLRKMQKIPL